MIDLFHSTSVGPEMQTLPVDPGLSWVANTEPIVDAAPDDDVNPDPAAQWAPDARRTGVCGAVAPRIIALPRGGYRLYYTQILPRPGFPIGAVDYENATSRILSAFSPDGRHWTMEPGVRLSAAQGGAGDFRVVSSEVVPLLNEPGRLRMYYECTDRREWTSNSIRSAISRDGLNWTPESGARLTKSGRTYISPRIVLLEDGRCRLYCCERGRGIISALSSDGGLTFEEEVGTRVAAGGIYDVNSAYAPEIVRVKHRGFVMYYSGYSARNRAHILRATSEDGLNWTKHPRPVIAPGTDDPRAVKCSEMCLLRMPGSDACRMFYEACDGTAAGERGVWRIVSATAKS